MESIKTKFQVLLGVTLFFPVTLDKIYYYSEKEMAKAGLGFGSVIGLLVLSYIILEARKPHPFTQKILSFLVLLSLASYAWVFILTGITPHGEELKHPYFFFAVMAYAFFAPMAIFVALVLDLLVFGWKKYWKRVTAL